MQKYIDKMFQVQYNISKIEVRFAISKHFFMLAKVEFVERGGRRRRFVAKNRSGDPK